jgi:hypothetical protein
MSVGSGGGRVGRYEGEGVMDETIEWSDRYGDAGAPSLLVGCLGDCEATGWVPIFVAVGPARDDEARPSEELDDKLVALWREAEAKEPSDDGWHFVRCPECGGTGRAPWRLRLTRNLPRWVANKASFARHHVFVWPYSDEQAELARVWQEAHVEPLDETAEGPWCPYRTAYADRLDVEHPYLWNRKLALRVLLGRVR